MVAARVALCVAVCASLAASPACAAQSIALKPELAGLAFLVGRWSSDNGKVADTGGRSAGRSVISIEADGRALLRRDHTDLFDKAGRPAGGFSQLMMIYAQGGGFRADYEDGEGHVIHYTSAVVKPGLVVTFLSDPAQGAPTFRLTYERVDHDKMAVTFGMTPPGEANFHPIATGTLERSR